MKAVKKPWGSFTDYYHSDNKHIKFIEINDNARLSLQSHKKRSELWTVVEGTILATKIPDKRYMGLVYYTVVEEGGSYEVFEGEIHRMQAINGPAKVIEISTGTFDEKDIVRIEDDYGRKGTKTI